MGCYNTILVPCPKCGEISGFQTKSGSCTLQEFTLVEAPQEDLQNVNRHSPYKCDCGTWFEVALKPISVEVKPSIPATSDLDEQSTS